MTGEYCYVVSVIAPKRLAVMEQGAPSLPVDNHRAVSTPSPFKRGCELVDTVRYQLDDLRELLIGRCRNDHRNWLEDSVLFCPLSEISGLLFE